MVSEISSLDFLSIVFEALDWGRKAVRRHLLACRGFLVFFFFPPLKRKLPLCNMPERGSLGSLDEPVQPVKIRFLSLLVHVMITLLLSSGGAGGGWEPAPFIILGEHRGQGPLPPGWVPCTLCTSWEQF